jgi:hypothetical protein
VSAEDRDPEIDPAWWEPAFTDDDLVDAEWRPPEIASRHLARLSNDAPEDSLRREVLTALALVASAMLDPENWDEPFKPMMVMGGQRSALPTDLSRRQYQLLHHVLPHIEQAPLRARIADALWCFRDRSDHELVRIAIDAYRAVPLERDPWVHRGDDAWRRAIELARRRGGAESERLDKMAATITQRIFAGSTREGFMLIDLSDLLRKCRQPDARVRAELAAHFTQLASTAAANSNLRMARHLERTAQRWFASVEDHQSKHQSIERIVDLYEREAADRAAGPSGAAMAAGLFLEKAIGTLRTLPRKYRIERNLESHLANLRRLLEDSREDTLEGMHRFQSDPIDLTDVVLDTRRKMSGHSRFDALVHLAGSWPLADPAKDRAQAEELLEGSLRHLFGGATYSSDGRKVAASEGGFEQPEAAIWSDMIRSASITRGVVATGFIVPGLDVVAFEHRYDQAYLRRICLESPWVPEGHEDLWARGLRHGLNGDFASALSVLVPQIEHALRRVLKSQGIYTLTVDDATGVESEKGLGPLLAMPEAEQLLGADMQYELTTLLIQQEGDNLRHDTAHGLLHDGQAWSHGSVYAWWLCLRLVVVPLWHMRNGDTSSQEEDESATSLVTSAPENPPNDDVPT